MLIKSITIKVNKITPIRRREYPIIKLINKYRHSLSRFTSSQYLVIIQRPRHTFVAINLRGRHLHIVLLPSSSLIVLPKERGQLVVTSEDFIERELVCSDLLHLFELGTVLFEALSFHTHRDV